MFALACVAAFALPFLLVSHFAGSPGTAQPPPAAHPVATTGSKTSTSTSTSSLAAARTTGPAPASASTGPAALAAATESCRLANLRLSTALSAADVSLAQFDKHIDAMNLLVAGKISLAVATHFWDETRVGATQNAAAFAAADRALQASRPSCRTLEPAVANTLPYGSVNAVATCSSYLRYGAAAMVQARAAVQTWRHHIEDMEMLRMGHITPVQATTMWTKNWHTGDRQLHSYELAEQRAKKSACSLT